MITWIRRDQNRLDRHVLSDTERQVERSSGGFTLLEVAIYCAVLITVGAPLVSVVLTSSRATVENDTVARVEERNRVALFRIEKEIRRGLSGTFVIGNGGSSLTFTPTVGFDGTSIITGTNIQFTFRLDSGETLNGADDDSDGAIDEGELVRTDVATGTELIISGAIDVANSVFALNGSGVDVTVATTGSVDRRYGTFDVSRSLTVYPRN